MRKLLIGFLLFIPFFARAQVKIGPRGGINLSNFIYRLQYSGDNKGSDPYLLRFNAGVGIEIPLNEDDNWFLYTGPYYSGKGSGSGRKFFSSKQDTIRTYLNYIELPISVGYKFSERNGNRFIASAGFYAAYGFNGKIYWKGGRPETEKHLHRKEEEKYRRFEGGINFIAMYEIKSKWGVRLDYSRSIFNIHWPDDKQKNAVFGFSFFWYLNKRKNIEK